MAFLASRAKRQILDPLLDLLLPPRCLKCGMVVDRAHGLCPDCWKGLVFIEGPACAVCGYPFGYDVGEGVLCAACTRAPRKFDRARAALRYDEASRSMVIGFKHTDRTEYARYFASLLYQAGREMFEQAHMILPVPLHKRRLFQRRYNQAALMSLHLSKMRDVAVFQNLLRRSKYTPPQQGGVKKRQKNVSGAFCLSSDISLKDKNIILVDDVFTTGATVEGCAVLLKRNGAKRVDVLTLCRVIRPL